jgi:hypothetical protein
MGIDQRFRMHEGAGYPAEDDMAWPFDYVAIAPEPLAARPIFLPPADRVSLAIFVTVLVLGGGGAIVWSFL